MKKYSVLLIMKNANQICTTPNLQFARMSSIRTNHECHQSYHVSIWTSCLRVLGVLLKKPEMIEKKQNSQKSS